MLANALIQETYPLPCDTGRPPAVVAPLFPFVDMAGLQDDWLEQTGAVLAWRLVPLWIMLGILIQAWVRR